MPARRASARVRTALLLALASLVFVPSAAAHADVGIELEAREGEHCTGTEVCLELVAVPPDLEPGHETVLELAVHPDANRSYRAALTTAEQADPDREATPASAAIAATPEAEPGQTVQVNLTSPDAAEGYAWLPGGDNEARGGWETFPLGAQISGEGEPANTPLGAGPLALALAGAALGLTQRR